jgi:hypothetical protein
MLDAMDTEEREDYLAKNEQGSMDTISPEKPM